MRSHHNRLWNRVLPVLVAAITCLAVFAAPGQAQEEAAPPKVAVAAAITGEITNSATFVGRGEAIDRVDLIARVNGFVEEVLAGDGSAVTEGDVLYRIEPDAYEAVLAAREAELARSEAQLDLASVELERRLRLVSRGTISEAEADEARANEKVAEANVQSAEAAIRQAELDVSYTNIVAPFDGRIGRTSVSVGELVGPSTPPIVTVIREAPIYVSFSVTEAQLVSILEQLQTNVEGLMAPDVTPEVHVTLPNGTEMEETGRIVFIDNRIDPATGSIAVRAEFENAQRLIVDGSFLTIRIEAAEPVPAVFVPLAAVQRDQRGDFVLVVTAQQMVEQRYVTLGEQVETDVVVESGLQTGESVIVEGLQRVRPGISVDAVLATGPVE